MVPEPPIFQDFLYSLQPEGGPGAVRLRFVHGGRFERFRFSALTVPLWKGLLCFNTALKDSDGSGFGS